MADTTKIGPIFRGANGGLSDDLFTGIQNSYYYSNLLEIREDSKSVYPSEEPVITSMNRYYTYALTDDTSRPECMLVSGDYLYIFMRYNVYRVNPDADDITPTKICTFSNERIHDATLFNGYIYIATEDGLYIISENASLTDWGNLASSTSVSSSEPYLGRITSRRKVVGYHPMLATDTHLIIGAHEDVYTVSRETCNLANVSLSINETYWIDNLIELGGYVRICATDLNKNTKIMLRDKVSSAVDETIPLTGYRILQTIVHGGYQYILSDKGLGVLNGYQFYVLKKAQGDFSSSIRGGICVYNEKIYFVASEGIYIYGAKNKNYNDVLSLRCKIPQAGAIYTDGYYLYTSRARRNADGITSSIAGRQPRLNPNEATSGELQTMCYYGGNMAEIKQAMYLKVGYKIGRRSLVSDNSTGSLEVYYRTDADAMTSDNPENREWHRLTQDGGINGKSDTRSPFSTTLKLNCRFQWIQFKFVLNSTKLNDDNYYHTHLYSADLYYNTMLD